jgi:hypothetical protein
MYVQVDAIVTDVSFFFLAVFPCGYAVSIVVAGRIAHGFLLARNLALPGEQVSRWWIMGEKRARMRF